MTIDIEHKGGDILETPDTSIRLTVTYPSYEAYILDFSDTDTQDLTDEIWSISEHWNYTISGITINSKMYG